MKKFKINKYLSLKLEDCKTNIYVEGKLFQQCKYLLLNIPIKNVRNYDKINSIDEAQEKLNSSLEHNSIGRYNISPEVEFWGHCSNLQAWYENEYDSRLLHSNLAFPLLKKLAEAGDHLAKKVFKEEIALRIADGYRPVINYLLDQGYLDYLNNQEVQTLFQSNSYLAFRIFIKKGQTTKALLMLEDILEEKIDSPHAWNYFREFFTDKKTIKEAVKTVRKILNKDPSSEIGWNLLAEAYSKLERYPEAIGAFKKALDLNEENLEILHKIGDIYKKLGRYSDALHYYKKAVDLEPNKSRCWDDLGLIYRKLEKYEKAAGAYEMALKFDKDSAFTWSYYALSLSALEEYEDAMNAIKKALALNNNDFEIWHNLFSQINNPNYTNFLIQALKDLSQDLNKSFIRRLFYFLIHHYKNNPHSNYTQILHALNKEFHNLNFGYIIHKNIIHIAADYQLYLYGRNIREIKELKGLEQLDNLKILNLQLNQISKINKLSNLKNLYDLDLSFNHIEKMENLEDLTNLRNLSLNFNNISKIEGLQELENLERLEIHNNKLEKIEGLDSLTNLKFLDLRNNNIKSIENLDKLKNLEILYLGGNQIEEIKNLKKLKHLKILELSNNPIEHIPDSFTFFAQSLNQLYLSNCSLDIPKSIKAKIKR
ncbi:MAG: leucine-rich repeat domain-containing protein [archaeon]